MSHHYDFYLHVLMQQQALLYEVLTVSVKPFIGQYHWRQLGGVSPICAKSETICSCMQRESACPNHNKPCLQMKTCACDNPSTVPLAPVREASERPQGEVRSHFWPRLQCKQDHLEFTAACIAMCLVQNVCNSPGRGRTYSSQGDHF